MTPALRVYPDLEALSLAVAGMVAAQLRDAVAARGRGAVVLSGGRTPRRLYELLADPRYEVPWRSVHIFWGDERYVPHDHPQSNYRMARLALLDRVAIPDINVHPIPTGHADPSRSAAFYEALLRSHVGGDAPRLDVVLLGLASDGHIASLFPGSEALRERNRWVTAVEVPADPPRRVTMTLPLINQAAHVALLVAGSTKAPAVARALQPGTNVEEVPAAGVAPASGSVTWWLDVSAAALIEGQAASR